MPLKIIVATFMLCTALVLPPWACFSLRPAMHTATKNVSVRDSMSVVCFAAFTEQRREYKDEGKTKHNSHTLSIVFVTVAFTFQLHSHKPFTLTNSLLDKPWPQVPTPFPAVHVCIFTARGIPIARRFFFDVLLTHALAFSATGAKVNDINATTVRTCSTCARTSFALLSSTWPRATLSSLSVWISVCAALSSPFAWRKRNQA